MSQVNTIFFGFFGDEYAVASSAAVLRTIKLKYPEAKITYCSNEAILMFLVGNPDIEEAMVVNTPQEMLFASVAKEYDKVMIPLIVNKEQQDWPLDSRWLCRPEANTLADYFAEKCYSDIFITDRSLIPPPPVQAKAA